MADGCLGRTIWTLSCAALPSSRVGHRFILPSSRVRASDTLLLLNTFFFSALFLPFLDTINILG